MKLHLNKINALAELERIGYKYTPRGDYEVSILCPVHDDTNPSVNLNVKKNLWNCPVCHAKGDIVSLLAYILQVERKTIIIDLSTRYDIEAAKTIKTETVERFHKQIWNAGPLLQELRNRGVDDDMIRKARLGYHDSRITIPIYNKNHEVINIRRYLPGAPGPEKMRDTKGYGGIRFFQVEQLNYNPIWICGGEMKALVAASILNEKNIGAVAVTGGEGAWSIELTKLLKDKTVYICMDIDASGRAAAKKIASQLGEAHIVHLPLDPIKYPKGDINDWVADGATLGDFLNLQETAEKFQLQEEVINLDVAEVKLLHATSAQNLNKRIVCEAVISALDTTPFIIPKDVGVSCTKDQPNCMYCPIRSKDPDTSQTIPVTVNSTAEGILEMVNAPSGKQREALRKALRIPSCKVVEFTVKSHYNISDVRLTPQLDIYGDNSDHIVQSAFVVTSKELKLNSPYVFNGRVYPSPKTQQAVLLLDDIEDAEDSLSSYKDDDLDSLKLFQPSEWTMPAIREQLNTLYEDLEANVTRIYKRRELHLGLDLTWLSCLYFDFDGRRQNGWINCLVTGDSSQGKSETTLRLMEHYGLGTRHDCKNATSAGLLGGLQQLGNRWFVSWGVIPVHDRQLVVMEEIKGMTPEVLGKLTDMRSSGVAEISMIEKRRSHARTRLIMISNPRSQRPINAHNYGIEAIKDLIVNLEDIRRFDFALILANEQIDPKEINFLSTQRPEVNHRFTSELCRRAVLWAWTRTPDQIRFDDNAIEACLLHATEMCTRFSESVPLVDQGTMRYKLAKLSIALAIRTFSVLDDNPSVIRVRKCHVEYITDYLLSVYADPIFGYEDFSKGQIFQQKMLDGTIVRRNILATKYPADFIEHLLHAGEITQADICDWCELERDEGQKLLSLLVRKRALYRVKRWYVKTSEFIHLLKQMKTEKIETSTEGERF